MKCIFCKAESSGSKSREHIIPESLGNHFYILDKGVVCDTCNNYFSLKIEKPLLNMSFFKQVRHKANVVSKKGNIPSDRGFMISPDAAVDFHKDKQLGETIEVNDSAARKKMKNRKRINVFSVIFAPPGEGNIVISKFIGKVGIELLAFYSQHFKTSLDDAVNPVCFDEIKRYIKKANKNEFWPYTARTLYHPEAGVHSPRDNQYYTIIVQPELINSEPGDLFLQLLIGGGEYTIDLLNPTTDFISEWFRKNNERSPALEKAIKNITS